MFRHLLQVGIDAQDQAVAWFVRLRDDDATDADWAEFCGWLEASPDHRANLLNPDFKCVGIGVYRAVGYEEMFTQDFSDCA